MQGLGGLKIYAVTNSDACPRRRTNKEKNHRKAVVVTRKRRMTRNELDKVGPS
jgi:hypothetical protein